MRENDDVEGSPGPPGAMKNSDGVLQLRDPDELLRGQRPDRDHQLRTENADFPVEVLAAAGDFVRIRDAITAFLRILSRETADHGGHVDSLAKFGLRHAEKFVEPAEEALPRGVRKRTPTLAFVRAGSLTHEHDARTSHTSGHRMTGNVRAGSAGLQCLEMTCEFSAPGCYHCRGR